MQSFIGLGGNVGDVRDTFQAALDSLDDYPQIELRRVSSAYVTPPMGEDAGDAYLNAVAELDADCPPLELLDALQAVESSLGRERTTRWGPRTLDLDLLFYGETVLETPRLILPHPGSWYRRFVLDPLAEIAPEFRHPVKALTVRELRERLLKKPFSVGIAGGEEMHRKQLAAELPQAFPDVVCDLWEPGEPEPCLLLWLGAGSGDLEFKNLPIVPRLDLTAFPEAAAVASRNVLTAALG